MPRNQPASTDEFSPEDTWNRLSKNIREIHMHNASFLSFEENYRYAYNMVMYKSGSMLYNGVCDLVAENVDRLAEEDIISSFPKGTSGDPDRVYTKANNVPEIWDAGLDIFLKHIIRPPIQDHILSAIVTLIQIERDGYVISRSAVKECVDVLLQLHLGQPDQETVEVRFQAEKSRTDHYLHSQTGTPLRKILEEHLLIDNLSTVIEMPNSGLDPMIDLDKIEDLNRLYRLFETVSPGLPTLRRALKASVLRRGKEINQVSACTESGEATDADPDKAETETGKVNGKAKGRVGGQPQTLILALKWVQDILELKDKFDRLEKEAFLCNREIESALHEAFEDVVNLNDKAPEFISLFIDENLKKGLKGMWRSTLSWTRRSPVFRYLTEKDAFERYYKSHLAKRLLYGRSVSDDAERGMLAKLKIECGYQFTQKLEGMFQDMKISSDTMQAYRKHLENTTAPAIEISVTVMTSTFWPMTHSGATCVLPEILTKSSKSFEQFYLSRHSGRRLKWQPSLGNVDVRVKFKARKHDLNVSTFGLVILLLFENLGGNEFLTYEEIQSTTMIPHVDLKRHLQSLACAKYKILKKHPPGRDVSAKVETMEERKETRERIDEERHYQIEACIVRVMKDRKHMTHNDLVIEVTRQLASRFQPNPQGIKKCMENLIDVSRTTDIAIHAAATYFLFYLQREYLERCEDRKSYNYLPQYPLFHRGFDQTLGTLTKY
ncbi:Cullin family-domain-containing protein [Pisolithus sp. B1]|nr:Cullin family-domain-containing protein [Pisolithus sp. B1]